MIIKKAFKLITTDGKIRSFEMLYAFLDRTVPKIVLFALSMLLYIVMTRFSLGNIIMAALFAAMMLVTVAFLLVIAGVAEISAELVAGCIVLRPEDLVTVAIQQNAARVEVNPASRSAQHTPPAVQSSERLAVRAIQTAVNPAAPSVLRELRKWSLGVMKDDALIRIYGKTRDKVTVENILCNIHVHCIREYEKLQQARGIQVYAIEAFWIWYALTDLMLENHFNILNPKKFRQCALRAMFLDIPEHTEAFIYESISQGYDRFVEAVCKLQRERIANNLPRQSRLECYLDTIGKRFNPKEDARSQDNLEMCIMAALDVAADELKLSIRHGNN